MLSGIYMPYWGEINFIDAISPSIVHLIFFYDHTIVVIITILIFLFCFMFDVRVNNILNISLIDNQFIEIVWTILPIVLLVFIAIPSLRLLYLIEESFTRDLTIKVLGHQWFWSYEYEELGRELDCSYNQNQLYEWVEEEDMMPTIYRLLEADDFVIIPETVRVRLLVRSCDVIHSWTVPRLGVKTDAVPGRLNQLNFFCLERGNFFGQCSEICGAFHRFMPIKLKVDCVEEFVDWYGDCTCISDLFF